MELQLGNPVEGQSDKLWQIIPARIEPTEREERFIIQGDADYVKRNKETGQALLPYCFLGKQGTTLEYLPLVTRDQESDPNHEFYSVDWAKIMETEADFQIKGTWPDGGIEIMKGREALDYLRGEMEVEHDLYWIPMKETSITAMEYLQHVKRTDKDTIHLEIEAKGSSYELDYIRGDGRLSKGISRLPEEMHKESQVARLMKAVATAHRAEMPDRCYGDVVDAFLAEGVNSIKACSAAAICADKTTGAQMVYYMANHGYTSKEIEKALKSKDNVFRHDKEQMAEAKNGLKSSRVKEVLAANSARKAGR